MCRKISLLLSILMSIGYNNILPGQHPGSNEVKINGRTLSSMQIQQLQKIYKVTPVPGAYWYDKQSGIFGNIGGPALGVMYPGHELGAMPSDASLGDSRVYVNGRELQLSEAQALARLFGYPAPVQGKYWLQADTCIW